MTGLREATLEYMDRGRRVLACDRVTLEVLPGEFLGILGPSGSGKSSLLYLMSGLKRPTAGQAVFEGTDLATLSEPELAGLRMTRFGLVFQFPYLIGHLTALENVVAASPDSPAGEAQAMLSRLGLEQYAHRLPHEMSGGQRQRVCVARALVGQPSVVFADEPTASLDHANGFAVVDALLEGKGNGALVMVTHDPAVLREASRVVRIVDGRLEPCD